MNLLKTTTYFTLVILIFSQCSSRQPTSEKKEVASKVNLKGSWKLSEFIPADSENNEWQTNGDSIIYEKHLTPDKFAWFKYDKKNEKLLGMGGGSYSIANGQYIEDIKFFYPPGSSELGQSIPFDYQMKDGIWYHTGYAKVMDMDAETGEIIAIDSNKIEEKWSKIEQDGSNDQSLLGTWKLDKYLDENQKDFVEYPGFVDYIKMITPTHFTWVYYNNEGDEIYAAGSGTYGYKDNQYSENIRMIYPGNSGQLGSNIKFTSSINSGKWKHAGYIPSITVDDETGQEKRDSTFIDEIWVRAGE